MLDVAFNIARRLRGMLDDFITFLNFSCSEDGIEKDCDGPVAAIVGSLFILAGCIMIVIVLCIFRYTGRSNDEDVVTERFRRDVSST